MIISHRYGFVFVKTRKTAGTSMEILLSRFCGPLDIITPISHADEAIRRQEGGVGPQNYGPVEPVIDFSRDDPSGQYARIPDRGIRFQSILSNHETARSIKETVGGALWNKYYTFAIERNPWDVAVSMFHFQNRTAEAGDRDMFSAWLEQGYTPNHPQYMDQHSTRVLVDKLYRYEDLDLVLDDLGDCLGIDLPRHLEIQSKPGLMRGGSDYRAYYTDESQSWVAARAERVIDLLSYEF